MQPQRIDVAELKAQVAKKIGPERSKRYFYILSRFFSQKLSKVEFDRFCFRLLGRENLPLHNQLICSILKNACQANTPPPIHKKGPVKSVSVGAKGSILEDGHERSGLAGPSHGPNAVAWSNGVVLPKSPRKGRSAIRDRKLRDRPSPLGPNGKVDIASHQSITTEDSGAKILIENGSLAPCDYQRVMQHPRGLAEQLDSESPRRKNLIGTPVSLFSKEQIEAGVEEGDELEQGNYSEISRGPLLAPLGIPFCSASIGGARKALPVLSTGDIGSCFDSGRLYDTETLRKYMEHIAVRQDLEGVSMECAHLLNNMLDVYLKRLINSCFELVEGRSGYEVKKHPAHKQQIQGKLINGTRPGNYLLMQNNSWLSGSLQEQRHHPISFLDFKTAMELNPQLLGEDWPLLREKICMNLIDK